MNEKSIIEKLGITPGPYTYRQGSENIYSQIYAPEAGNGNGGLVCTLGQIENGNDVRMFLSSTEMVKRWIDTIKRIDTYRKNKCTPNQLLDFIYLDAVFCLEGATGKPWGEIEGIIYE